MTVILYTTLVLWIILAALGLGGRSNTPHPGLTTAIFGTMLVFTIVSLIGVLT